MFVDFQNYDNLREAIFNDIASLNFIPLDIETTGLNCWFHKPLLLIIKGEKEVWVFDLRTIPKLKIKKLLQYIAGNKTIVGHNLKFDCKFLLYHYNVIFKKVYCTYLASKLIWNGVKSKEYSLAFLVKFFLEVELEKETRNSFIDKPDTSPFTDEEILYAEKDVEYLLKLKDSLDKIISKYDMNFLVELENKFLISLCRIELKGVNLDVDSWKKNIKNTEKERLDFIFRLDEELFNLSKKFTNLNFANFDVKIDNERKKVVQTNLFFEDDIIDIEKKARVNWASPAQIRQICFLCNLSIESTSEDALLEYNKANPDHPLFKLFELLVGDGYKQNGLRQIEKLLSTYGENFLKYINPITGKIHPNFGQVNTDTGRLNSGDQKVDGKKMFWSPNIQNIPATNTLRNCFVAPAGYLFCSCDLSGCELRLAASESQDPILLASFNEGLDLHSHLAQKSFRIIKNDPNLIISKEENTNLRTVHKSVIFG